MTVRELSPEHLEMLRVSLYYNPFEATMTESQFKMCMCADFPSEIPDELVYEVFDGVHFVEDDFSG